LTLDNCANKPAPSRRRFLWAGGSQPPPTKTYRGVTADTVKSVQSSRLSVEGRSHQKLGVIYLEVLNSCGGVFIDLVIFLIHFRILRP